MKNPNTHNRLVAGSNPAEPTKLQVLPELIEIQKLIQIFGTG